MIEFFSNYFIKKHCENSSNVVRRMYGITCSVFGIILNLVMFLLKLAASAFTGSVAAAVDAVHNLTDSASSVVTLLSFLFSGQKRTKKFPMGKGRIEYVAGFIVAVVLISAGFELAKASVTKIITPEPVTFSMFSVGLLIISFLTKLYMAYFNSRIGKKISSAALKAASIDCLCDSIATVIAALAVVAVKFTSLNVDAWGGLAVSLFILYAGCKAAKDTVKMLIGVSLDEKTHDNVKDILDNVAEIIEIKEILLHDYGPENRIIAADVVFDNDISVDRLCQIQKKARERVRQVSDCDLMLTTNH